MRNKELEIEFTKWFGNNKWNEEETLYLLHNIGDYICMEYLGIVCVPLMFDELCGCIAYIDITIPVIKLNIKYKNDKIKLLGALVHEIEHLYQYIYASNCDTKKAIRWRKELESDIFDDNDPSEYLLQGIEIDAESFAKVILKSEFGIDYINRDPKLEALIVDYIESGNLMSE